MVEISDPLLVATAKSIRDRNKRRKESSDEEEEEGVQEESSSDSIITLPPAKRRREASVPQSPPKSNPPLHRSPPRMSNPIPLQALNFTPIVIKAFYPFWFVEGEKQVFIWLLRIPTCTGSISCSGNELLLSYNIARPPLALLRDKLDSDDLVFWQLSLF